MLFRSSDDVHGGMDHIHPGDINADAHHEVSFLRLLSLRAVVAFLTFFGLAGLASMKGGVSTIPALGLALGAGLAALVLVAWLMSVLSKLQSAGNVNFGNAVGTVGKVYLTVPANRTSTGKVTVAIQGRTMEIKAVTSGPAIPTGNQVRIVGLSAPDTLEVQRQENV